MATSKIKVDIAIKPWASPIVLLFMHKIGLLKFCLSISNPYYDEKQKNKGK